MKKIRSAGPELQELKSDREPVEQRVLSFEKLKRQKNFEKRSKLKKLVDSLRLH